MDSNPDLVEQLVSSTLGLLYLRDVAGSCHEHARDVPDYVRQAVPVFVALALAEFVFLQWRRPGRSAFSDHTASLACGVAHLVVSAAAGWLPVVLYTAVWQRWRALDLPWDSPAVWLLALLGVDFCFYWRHRCVHEVAALWAMHQAHHSSEFFNLSTALRQPALQTFVTGVFYLPLAALGVPPAMWLTHRAFNFVYQFWVHTELVGSLGPLELVFNTPSHHRVHHASNPRYLDKNYGGFLIVWDRLFGTFCPEEEPPTYGLLHNVNTFELATIQLGDFWRLASAAGAETTWPDVARRVLYGPGWTPGGPRLGDTSSLPEPDRHRRPFSVPIRAPLRAYVFVQFSLAGCALLWPPSAAAAAALPLSAAATSAALVGGVRHARRLEMARCLAVIIWLLVSPAKSALVSAAGVAFFAASLGLWLVCPKNFWYGEFNKAQRQSIELRTKG